MSYERATSTLVCKVLCLTHPSRRRHAYPTNNASNRRQPRFFFELAQVHPTPELPIGEPPAAFSIAKQQTRSGPRATKPSSRVTPTAVNPVDTSLTARRTHHTLNTPPHPPRRSRSHWWVHPTPCAVGRLVRPISFPLPPLYSSRLFIPCTQTVRNAGGVCGPTLLQAAPCRDETCARQASK